jgi:hypothetical protein
MPRRLILLGLLALGALVQVSPAPLRAWDLEADSLRSRPVPALSRPLTPPAAADLKDDGQFESLSVKDGRASLLAAGTIVWQSPAGWQVLQAAITDLDRDGRPEVALLVWRPFKPWPVDRWLPYGGRIQAFQDAAGRSCHLILIGRRRDGYGELWAGSALSEPVRAFAAADLDGDGAEELITLDGRYSDPGSAPARALKVWTWNGFGFTLVSSMAGTFSGLAIVQAPDGRYLILTP